MEEISLLKAIREISRISIRKEKILVSFLIFTFIINLFLWFFIYLNYKNLSETVIIHYSAITGVDQIDKKIYLFKMPLAGLSILIINFICLTILSKKSEKLLSYFLVFSSFIINIFLILSSILIVTV
ncbi:MAG: hypothetical protein ACK413_00100 [Patescibacteria group bacterium]